MVEIPLLLPLDRRGGFAGDVVRYTVHSGDLGHDAAGDASQHLVRQLRPVGGHGVA